METWEQELRLLWLLGINALAAFAAWRAAGALSGNLPERVCDALLGWWLIQYLAVGCTGALGMLGTVSVTAVGVALSGGVLVLSRRGQPASNADPTGQVAKSFILGGLFVAAFVAALAFDARILPALADDPLTYHLPAAAQWLQQGRISLFETWYFNPANTYSPLAGSMFLTWLMAPAGSDVIARFGQGPAVIAIYAGGFALARRLGAGAWTATLIGVSASLCRPIISQAILAKDDLFLCALVLLAVNAAGRTGPGAAVRLGVAIGMAGATKYTSVYSLLIVMCCLSGHRCRDWLRAVAVAMVILIPWLIRNAIVTGNPVFPLLIALGQWTIAPGLFSTMPSERLRSAAGVWASFVPGYFGIGVPMLIALSAAYIAAAASARRLVKEPLARAVLLGPPISMILFLLTSPYAELRFLYAGIALLSCSAAMILPRGMQCVAAGILAAVSAFTSFAPDWTLRMFTIAGTATLLAAGVFALARLDRRLAYLTAAVAGLAFSVAVWVHWSAYVRGLPAAANEAWIQQRGELARAWRFVWQELPPDEPLAYANTYLVYPLMGPELNRRVVGLGPTLSGRRLHEMPPIGRALNESTLLDAVMTRIAETDLSIPPAEWNARLAARGIRYLFLAKRLSPWPERQPTGTDWAYERAAREAVAGGMRVVFENDAAVVLRVGS